MSLRSFQGDDGRFKKGTHWRPHAIFRERAYLTAEYVEKCRSAGDIAREHGVSDASIYFWLRKHEIPRRDVSAARKAKHWGCAGPANPMYGMRGAKSHNYIDGSSPERQRTYAQYEWKQLLVAVYRRDGFVCKRCGRGHSKDCTLVAHHIKGWAKNPTLRRDMTNLVTLCIICHRWVHSKANVEKEWLGDF